MLLRVNSFQQADYLPDIPAHVTPLHMLSHTVNARLRAAKLQKFRGAAATNIALTDAPRYLVTGQGWWLVAGLTSCYSVVDLAVTDITSVTSFTASEETGWVGENFNGLAVLTNGIDNPVMWSGSGYLDTLTAWPPGDVTACTCKTLRGFKNYLIAGNLIEDSVHYPNVIRWSHPADPGAAPASWDITDTTKDAGRYPLADTQGVVYDSLSLGEVHMVYKNDATYMLQDIGGVFVLKITPLSLHSGILRPNCVTSIGRAHVALSEDDVVLVTPQGVESIAHNRVRSSLFSSIRGTELDKVFLAHNVSKSEVWCCVPTESSWPDRAWVWNYKDNKWYVRELPDVAFITFGQSQTEGLVIDSATMVIDDALFPIDNVLSLNRELIGARYAAQNLITFEGSDAELSADMTVVVEHHSYDFADAQGAGPEKVKLVTKLRPHFSVDTADGVQVDFQLGTQMEIDDPITWSTVRTYTVGGVKDLFFRVSGRYLSWRVTSTSQEHWELDGFDLTYQVGGVY